MRDIFAKKIVIKSYPLDELLKGYFKRALVKIDVEGAEEEVISGMKKFLKKNKPDIFCEIGHNHKKIINFIVKLGYKYIKIDWKSFYLLQKIMKIDKLDLFTEKRRKILNPIRKVFIPQRKHIKRKTN